MAIDYRYHPDFTRYQPPGVYTEDAGGPQLAVRSSVPTAVAIFGTAVGYRTYRESIRINPDQRNDEGDLVPVNNAPLAKQGAKVITGLPVIFATGNVDVSAVVSPIEGLLSDGEEGEYSPENDDLVFLTNQTKPAENGLYRFRATDITVEGVTLTRYTLAKVVDSFKLVNPATGYTYVRGLDYTIELVDANAETDNPDGDARVWPRNDLYTIKRKNRGAEVGIQEGDVVQVFYHYTDPDYHEVHALYDYDDVRDFYGEPFDANGNIQSEVTLAAKFAFINGAASVLTCAIDPEDPDNPGIGDYDEALNKFRDEDQIAIIVPGTGSPEIQQLVQQHVNLQSNLRYERRAVIGIDGSASVVPTSSRIEYAQSVSDKRIALVSPSRFTYYAPELNKSITLGGQFMAAAVAGRSVSMIPAMPLTRKNIVGFTGPAEIQREGEKNLESQNGLMVIEKTRRNQIQVRHGVTTNSSELLTREWSIIGQQDVMVYRIRDYLDNDGLIGMPIYDTTLIQVKASAEAALVSLVRDGVIVGYQNLKVRQIGNQPDVVEVRYEWKPAYPLNYIVVRYSVAVIDGDVTVNEAIA